MNERIAASVPRTRRNSGLLLHAAACAVLAGCAASPVDPDALFAAPDPARAVVVGWGNTAGEKARAALTTVYGARVSSLYVAKANAQKSGVGENIARLPPGDYELTITCGLFIDYRYFPHDTVVQATLSANRVYRLRAAPEGRKCQPTLEDVTDKQR